MEGVGDLGVAGGLTGVTGVTGGGLVPKGGGSWKVGVVGGEEDLGQKDTGLAG